MKPELNENDQFIYSWQENLMIFSRQDELPANHLAFLYTI